jgi:hypothetical protein
MARLLADNEEDEMQPSILMNAVDAHYDLLQAEMDERADREAERRERIEASVTFDELLEELTKMCADRQKRFMDSIARDDAFHVLAVLSVERDAIVMRKMREGQ